MSVTRQTEPGPGLRPLDPQPPPRRSLSSRFGMLHLIAVASGLLAFILILSWMRSQEDMIEVMVATDIIRSGNVVDGEMFSVVEIPAAAGFGGAFLDPDRVRLVSGSIATRTIAPGEPVLVSDLRAVEVPSGLRAMSVPVDVNRAVGGEISIGDRVDVIGFDQVGAHYIATDVEVLDVPGSRASTFGTTTAFAVTLAVDDIQALEMAQALDFGAVHVLRSTGAPEITLERILGGPDAGGPADGEASTAPPDGGG